MVHDMRAVKFQQGCNGANRGVLSNTMTRVGSDVSLLPFPWEHEIQNISRDIAYPLVLVKTKSRPSKSRGLGTAHKARQQLSVSISGPPLPVSIALGGKAGLSVHSPTRPSLTGEGRPKDPYLAGRVISSISRASQLTLVGRLASVWLRRRSPGTELFSTETSFPASTTGRSSVSAQRAPALPVMQCTLRPWNAPFWREMLKNSPTIKSDRRLPKECDASTCTFFFVPFSCIQQSSSVCLTSGLLSLPRPNHESGWRRPQD